MSQNNLKKIIITLETYRQFENLMVSGFIKKESISKFVRTRDNGDGTTRVVFINTDTVRDLPNDTEVIATYDTTQYDDMMRSAKAFIRLISPEET